MIENTLLITWTFRSGEDGAYTFSVKAFKAWKNKFQQAYLESYGTSFKEDVKNSRERETLYKLVHKMGRSDIFQTERPIVNVDQSIFERVMKVQSIIAGTL